MSRSVAVIDIGSNSIKLLVASPAPGGGVTIVSTCTLDARISAGISQAEPRLSEAGMASGLEAIQTLLADAATHSPEATVLVATSAVRDARNGTEFRERVRTQTGHEIRILSGSEEAALIGRGLLCDPALSSLRDFYVFDLGGGSLECLSFRARKLEQALSLQLGCVRLTERFIADPSQPFNKATKHRITQHVREELIRSQFRFSLPREAAAVGTGGTIATMRWIFAAQRGVSFDQTDSYVPLIDLRRLLTRVSAMTLDERRTLPGLPPPRADIFPTALATLSELADVAAVPGFRHSLFNLRYGLAADALGVA